MVGERVYLGEERSEPEVVRSVPETKGVLRGRWDDPRVWGVVRWGTPV